MPLALDPDQTIDVWLPSDAAKPADSRPKFKTRFMSWGERRRVDELRQEALAEKDGDAAWNKLTEAYRIACVGWANMGRDFAPDAHRSVLTLQELFDLTGRFLEETTLKEADLKNSGRPQPSSGAESAAGAAATDAASGSTENHSS